MSRQRWWLPSITAAIWLAFFLGLSLSDWRLVFISADGDPSLHWRLGNWMIENRAVLRADVFSHTRPDAPLISKEWLSEVVFAAAGNALGWNGIVLVAAALIAATLALLHRQLLREGRDLLLATGLVMLAALACAHHWLARPHLLTQLLAVVFVCRLRDFEGDRLSARALALQLAPLMMLWANAHGAFFTGFVLIGVFLAGNALRRDWPKTTGLLGVAAAALAASLVNPNGWRLHAHIIEFLRTPVLAGFANEFASPNFHSGGMRGFLLVLLVLGVLLMVKRPRLSATEVLLIGAWGVFALRSVRNVPVFALTLTPILAEHLGLWRRCRDLSAKLSALHKAADGRALVTAAVLAMAAAAVKPVLSTEILPSRFPVEAVKWLKKHPEAVRGEMFNDYGWGGYLLLALPERRVFVDGRNDFYGADLIEEFNVVDDAKPGWDGVLEKYGVGWTILPGKHPLNRLLERHAGWSLAWTDDVATLYRREPQE
jgi:hypothetical protein